MAIKFMGASVSNFNVNVSFGLQPSELSIVLAEDLKAGDKFAPPPVGEPTVFNVGNFVFGGFLQSWTERKSTDGHLFEVKIIDPREFLSGITLILKGYTGHTGGISNLFNLYGYHLNRDPSRLNDAGMMWGDVVSAFNSLSTGVLRYRQYRFNISMAGLPNLPYYYRIPGESMSLLDFIGELCDAGGLDFYVDFDGSNINVVTFARSNQPQPGLIKQFVDSVSGATSKEIGNELRLDTVNTFLLGGKVRQFYYQFSSFYNKEVAGGEITIPTHNVTTEQTLVLSGSDEQVNKRMRQYIEDGFNPSRLKKVNSGNQTNLYLVSQISEEGTTVQNVPSSIGISSDNNIWPYWGEDETGNLIIGAGYNDDHNFDANISDIGIIYNGQQKTKYPTNVAEIRAAAESRDSWEAFLGLVSGNKYEISPTGIRIGYMWDVTPDVEDSLTTLIRDSKPINDGTHPLQGLLSHLNIKPQIQDYIRTNWQKYVQSAYKDKNNPKLGFRNNVTLDELVEAYYRTEISGLEPDNIYVTYRHNGRYNIHYGKVFMLELSGVSSTKIVSKILDSSTPISAFQLGRMGYDPSSKDRHPDVEHMVERLHNKLSELYTGYYGKKFMVRIPFNVNRLDGDITRISTTLVPTDSAPVDETMVDTAVASNVLPQYYSKLLTEDGKIEAYVRADLLLKKVTDPDEKQYNENVDEYKFAEIDTSAFSPEDYVYNSDGSSVFVRCQVDPDIKFYNRDLLYQPRAIIELPGQLFYKDDGLVNAGHKGQISKIMNQVLNVRLANGDDDAGINANEILKGFGTDVLLKGNAKLFAYPVFAAIPLESQVTRYGPFYNLNMPGKVEMVIDDDLNPWTYGSYANMYGAGYAKIIDSLSGQYSSETGSVSVPGFPAISPGRPIVLGGPNVTNIACSVSDGGVVTTYRMSSWTNRFGKIANQYVDAIQRQIADMNKVRALLTKRFATNSGRQRTNNFTKYNKPDRPAREKSNSSHAVLGAEVKDGRYDIFSLPNYHFNQQVGESDYEKQAFMSLDGLFVPVSFGSGEAPSGMGRYPYLGSGDATGGNANNLNPYYDGDVDGVGLIAVGEKPEESEGIHTIGRSVRGLGLKAPLVLSGWGYDTDDDPVPKGTNPHYGQVSGVSRYVFASGYKTDVSSWKTGPLDVRWDDDRKVWAAGGGISAKLVDIMNPSGTDYPTVVEYTHTGSGLPASGWSISNNWYKAHIYNDDSEILYVKNVRNSIAPPSRFLAWKIDGVYYIDNQVSFVL